MIQMDIPSWCTSVKIKQSSVATGEVEVWLVGEADGSTLLVYGEPIFKFLLEVIGDRSES